jgi:hypothetical protein
MLFGRVLVMSTIASAPGRVSLDAYLGGRRLGGCASKTPGGRIFTCRVRLGRRVSLRAHIKIVASLRVGNFVVHSLLQAQRIQPMRMGSPASNGRAASAASMFWCSPSTLTAVLANPVSLARASAGPGARTH